MSRIKGSTRNQKIMDIFVTMIVYSGHQVGNLLETKDDEVLKSVGGKLGKYYLEVLMGFGFTKEEILPEVKLGLAKYNQMIELMNKKNAENAAKEVGTLDKSVIEAGEAELRG